MAQTVAVVRATLTATLSGTTDFTKTGFGTPAAALIVLCNANSVNNPAANARLSIGFWEGTNNRVVAIVCNDNVTTTDTARSQQTAYSAAAAAVPSSTIAGFSASATTDGVRLTMDLDSTTVQWLCTVIMFAGVSCSVGSLTMNATQNNTATSASIGFAPGLIFFITTGQAISPSGAATAVLSFGFCDSSLTQRLLCFFSADAAADEDAQILFSETRAVGRPDSWTGEVTTVGSDTFTVTTRDAGSSSAIIYYMALGGAALSFDCGTLTTPTGTGNDAVATGVAPDAVLVALSTAQGTTVETDADANGLMVGLADDNGQFCHNMSVEDLAGTTNTNSAAQAAALIDLDTSIAGARTDLIDGTVTLNASDFTINYSAVSILNRKGWWVAFGVPAGGGGNPWNYYAQAA